MWLEGRRGGVTNRICIRNWISLKNITTGIARELQLTERITIFFLFVVKNEFIDR
jgi:hypothetical protein